MYSGFSHSVNFSVFILLLLDSEQSVTIFSNHTSYTNTVMHSSLNHLFGAKQLQPFSLFSVFLPPVRC